MTAEHSFPNPERIRVFLGSKSGIKNFRSFGRDPKARILYAHYNAGIGHNIVCYLNQKLDLEATIDSHKTHKTRRKKKGVRLHLRLQKSR